MTNPGNTVRIRSRTGGRESVYEANMWAQKFTSGLFDGNGVIENTSPNMSVRVGGGSTKPDVVLAQNPAGYKIALDLVSQQTLTITAPASNSRISSIVAYTDDLSISSTDTTNTGNPGYCGLIVVNGTTAASPTAPSDSTIRSAITSDGATGSQASYCVIAEITVASTTTTITNSLISPGRKYAQMNGSSLVDGSTAASKIDWATLLLGSYTRTTNATATTSNVAISGASLSVTTATGNKLKITVSVPFLSCSSSPTNSSIAIWDGNVGSGTQVGYAQVTTGGPNYGAPANIVVLLHPSAGVHTYNLGLSNIGGGTSTATASSSQPLSFLIERVG